MTEGYYAITEHYYYTVIVPYSSTPTEWHSTEPDGPFKVLCRGAFQREADAVDWAKSALRGNPYTIQRNDWTDIDWPN